ncbi:aminoglycoside 3'-phosphotransferase [Clostridium sp. D2Q-14]|uniref:APH(3') family aminoglycoside O-phosphotransferase n=1 Tax=Anaeromonas gelatinilytica TaxID=2683194 RepID=UPI00193B12C2|nr:APH(3') family aminoglycoside O-phosphotransferase [Anaeromonas gelatinilytica]MBS4534310.1 aminoglycoside 3'-phosphotransferase [Anaeromonas gelatinilytica]
MKYDLPLELREIIDGCEITKNNKGWSESDVFQIEDILKEKEYYLKISPDDDSSYLISEKEKLEWLQDKIPVPKIHFFKVEKGFQYLLTSKILGEDALSRNVRRRPIMLIKAVAKGLKKIHAIDIEDCPFDERLENKLNLVKDIHIENKRLNSPIDRIRNKNILDLYNYLIENKKEEEDLVFTHGDYCFPNIIINGENISGFIDVGRAGIGDRYVDLSLIIRSIRINYRNNKLVDKFIEEYGLDYIDSDKLKYYTHLDELIN